MLAEFTLSTESQPGSSIDQDRNFRMREHFDCLTPENDRGHAVATMRGHDDKVTALRLCGIDDRMVRMFVVDNDQLVYNACCLRRASADAKDFPGVLLHASFVLGRCILHICVSVVNT